MPKLTVDDLKKIKDNYKAAMTVRDGGARAKVTVHMGTCGITAGARKVMESLLDEINKNSIADVIVTTSGCAGFCSKEPMVTVELLGSSPVKYISMNEDKMRKVVQEHLLGGKIVEDCALVAGNESSY
ncbi:MAG: (2Fe-2S) ferredoxin domain-containing protein [Nitrospirae bacterium]|nr:MAG: (2Fe-2S) ferredoxin domain-containing protein [Nitrospirota bacterium]